MRDFHESHILKIAHFVENSHFFEIFSKSQKINARSFIKMSDFHNNSQISCVDCGSVSNSNLVLGHILSSQILHTSLDR